MKDRMKDKLENRMKDRKKQRERQKKTKRKTDSRIARKNASCQKYDLIIKTSINIKLVFPKIFPSNHLETIF